MQYAIKVIITTIVIVAVSELAKRFTIMAAILASLPLVSILAIIWLYHDNNDVQQVIDFSTNMFWAVLPSLVFFLVLPFLLKSGLSFSKAMITSVLAMVSVYTLYTYVLKKLGIDL